MPPPPGFAEVWVLKRSRPDSAGECPRYCVASHAEDPEPGCTCPDHRRHGNQCKHIRALVAHGLIARPVAEVPPPPPSPAPPVAPSFAEGFRQAVSDHIAARRPAAAPSPVPSPIIVESPAKARRAHAPRAREALAAAPAPAPSPRLIPEGWQPGGAYFAASEAEAIAALPPATAEDHIRRSQAIAAREDARHHARPRRKAKAPVTTS
jgi:hypothetical protein